MNTEQQLRAEIARLNTLLDSVGAGGVGEGKLMPPAAQPGDHTATERQAVDHLIAHVQQMQEENFLYDHIETKFIILSSPQVFTKYLF